MTATAITECTLWCLIEGGLEKSPKQISREVGINGGLENCRIFNRWKYGKVLRKAGVKKVLNKG